MFTVFSHSEMASEFRICTNVFVLYMLSVIFGSFKLGFAVDRITSGESIRDRDGEVLISAREKFALGFFSPQGSVLRYVGIWYNQVSSNQSVVWVANRERPILGRGGVFRIGVDGNLYVVDENGVFVWSSNVTVESSNHTAFLMDSGNLVLRSNVGEDSRRFLWQSFDYPTDTYLPDMRVHINVRGDETRVFSSWRSGSDPSPGNFSMGIDPKGSPQIVIWEGQNRRWRSGPWNGLVFTGIPGLTAMFWYGFRLLNEGDGRMYFMYSQSNSSILTKFWVTPEGIGRQDRWDEGANWWDVVQYQPSDECQQYNKCGPFGICSSTSNPLCSCIEGFEPTDRDQWERRNWSGGCIRSKELDCEENNGLAGDSGNEDRFLEVQQVKLPDFVGHVGPEDVDECRQRCLDNCSCTAYAFVGGINCMIWTQDLVDFEQFAEGGSTVFIRLAHSESGDKDKVTKIVIIVAVVAGVFLLSVSMWLLWRQKLKMQGVSNLKKKDEILTNGRSGEVSVDFSGPSDISVEVQQGTGSELAVFDFNYVAVATNNFCNENKLGQGGFGPVHKGILPGGQEIAVKRLSRKSGQGCEEFKNELTLIAKLQHRNLVRLLGCCIDGEEKMLLYEYMPNGSLDLFLFDPSKKALLDWRKRFTVIEGIARGLVYLHRDSRLRIIHRDLKASNILLDDEMNPKVSDFGMARIFGGNQNEANTNRVVGTYGYMAPEYAMEGLFSVKSDVYSFGILLLEIITGRRNTSFRSAEHSNIIGHAWDLWDRSRAFELVDPTISNSCNQEEVMRCIHIGMLCVQDVAANRPNMPAVVLMLESENASLPMPKQPTYTSMRHSIDSDTWNEIHDVVSSNNVTISVILGR